MNKMLVSALVLLLVPGSVCGAWIEGGLPLSDDPRHQYLFELVPDTEGGVIAVFCLLTGTGPLDDVVAKRVAGNGQFDPGWPSGGVVLRSSESRRTMTSPSAIPDGSGGAIVVWYSSEIDGTFIQRVSGSGSIYPGWPADAVRVSLNAARNPNVVSDGGDGAIVFWNDSAPDVFAQRFDGSGTAVWQMGGMALSDPDSGGSGPLAVTDGIGGAIVLWPRLGTLGAVRIDGSGAKAWGGDRLIVCDEAGSEILSGWTRIVTDGAGGAIAVWMDLRHGADLWDVYAQRIAPDGTMLWSPNGVPVAVRSDLTNDAPPSLSVCSDAAHGFFAAWREDFDDGTKRIFVQHITGDGTPAAGWPVNGIGASLVDNFQIWVELAPDGQGGAFAIFDRSGPEIDDIYIQHFDAGGVDPAWPRNGILLNDPARDSRERLGIIPDGSGGAYTSWSDRVANAEVRLSRVHPSGSLAAVGEVPAAGREAATLMGNYPNPFNPQTTIAFELHRQTGVSLRVFDISGRLVRELMAGDVLPSGRHHVAWNGKDSAGRQTASGTYFYRLETGSCSDTKRMVLVK